MRLLNLVRCDNELSVDAGADAGHAAAGHGPQALFAMEIATCTA